MHTGGGLQPLPRKQAPGGPVSPTPTKSRSPDWAGGRLGSLPPGAWPRLLSLVRRPSAQGEQRDREGARVVTEPRNSPGTLSSGGPHLLLETRGPRVLSQRPPLGKAPPGLCPLPPVLPAAPGPEEPGAQGGAGQQQARPSPSIRPARTQHHQDPALTQARPREESACGRRSGEQPEIQLLLHVLTRCL